jgi:hypothetical protein
MPTKITTHIQNITPDNAMNDQKKSPNESNIYHSFFPKNQTTNDKKMTSQVNTPVNKKNVTTMPIKNSITSGAP